MAVITRHPRNLVQPGRDFEWSSSWTHNIFRVYELVFGRRNGVKVEVISGNDGETQWQYGVSFEGKCAVFEDMVRNMLHFKLPEISFQRVPVMRLANGMQFRPSLLPYSFALAFDAQSAGDGGTNTSTPTSTTHICTGSNLALATGIWNQGTLAQTPATVTYNAISLGTNKVEQDNGATQNVFMYGLAAPASGSHSLTWTYTLPAVRNGNCNISLTGAAASPFGTAGGNTNAGTSVSKAISTAADNSIVVSFCMCDFNAAASATGTNQTYRTGVITAGGYSNDISTQTTTAHGSYTSSWSRASASTMNMVSLEVEPLVATVNSNFLMFM